MNSRTLMFTVGVSSLVSIASDDVLTVAVKELDEDEVFPAASVAVAVMVCAALDNVLVVILHDPSEPAVAVPIEVAPS